MILPDFTTEIFFSEKQPKEYIVSRLHSWMSRSKDNKGVGNGLLDSTENVEVDITRVIRSLLSFPFPRPS